MHNCPFCGSARYLNPQTHYNCGQPIKPRKDVYRPGLCYEGEIANQAALLSEILPLLQAIDSGYSQRQREQMREKVKELLPQVEKVVEKKGGE